MQCIKSIHERNNAAMLFLGPSVEGSNCGEKDDRN